MKNVFSEKIDDFSEMENIREYLKNENLIDSAHSGG